MSTEWKRAGDGEQYITIEGTWEAKPCQHLMTQNLDTDRVDKYWVPKAIVTPWGGGDEFHLILPGAGGLLLLTFVSVEDAQKHYATMEAE